MGDRIHSCRTEVQTTRLGGKYGDQLPSLQMKGVIPYSAATMFRPMSQRIQLFPVSFIAMGIGIRFLIWSCLALHCWNSFGSYVTHSLDGFLYFSIDKLERERANMVSHVSLIIVTFKNQKQRGLWFLEFECVKTETPLTERLKTFITVPSTDFNGGGPLQFGLDADNLGPETPDM